MQLLTLIFNFIHEVGKSFSMGKSERPEHVSPPEIFYDEQEAHKYTCNSRIISVQAHPEAPTSSLAATSATAGLGHFRSIALPQAALTERALELLALPDDQQPKLLLDLGCGSGLSGEALSDAGHVWVVRQFPLPMPDTVLLSVLCVR